jgi:uncharacterized protein
MGFKELFLKMPSDYSDEDLHVKIKKDLGLQSFTYRIDGKSLDARHKGNIHWLIKVIVSSGEISSGEEKIPSLEIPYKKNAGKVIIAGNGPAGFFAALTLQKAGYETIILERGKEVSLRTRSIRSFERTGEFDSSGNYAFGEGGAGTFSDGKLTSRSKHISLEREMILQEYIKAGAPEEIAYMTHPHVGSDNLKKIVVNLRKQYEAEGGKVYFETLISDIKVANGKVLGVFTSMGDQEADHFIFAIGHSAYESYRMLMRRGVLFRVKNFALGSRMEHPQELINLAQWGKSSLKGVKAAEYRLSFNPPGKSSVYTFCMCPGGMIVPATAYEKSSVVNGMSMYKRNMPFANAACVAAVNPLEVFGSEAEPLQVLEYIETMEQKFFGYTGSYSVPACNIDGFIRSKTNNSKLPQTSFPNGIVAAPLWELLPAKVADSMREGLINFSRKMRGFESGLIMGLESKTSAPIQVLREEDGKCTGFDNLYMAGEGSGYAGGIISSGADGIRTAMKLIRQAIR